MQLTKKIVTYVTIGALGLVSLLLILMLCKVNLFGNAGWSVVITFACLGVGGFFAINSINMIDKNKPIGCISLGLICISVVLIIINTWVRIDSDLYVKITWSLGLLSVLFTIIVSSGLDLGKNKLAWQIAVYAIVGFTDIFITLIIFGILNISKMLTLLLILIILSISGVILLKVIAKKSVDDTKRMEKDMIKITKSEYQTLVEKAKKYDEIVLLNKNNTTE